MPRDTSVLKQGCHVVCTPAFGACVSRANSECQRKRDASKRISSELFDVQHIAPVWHCENKDWHAGCIKKRFRCLPRRSVLREVVPRHCLAFEDYGPHRVVPTTAAKEPVPARVRISLSCRCRLRSTGAACAATRRLASAASRQVRHQRGLRQPPRGCWGLYLTLSRRDGTPGFHAPFLAASVATGPPSSPASKGTPEFLSG